jgi:hypothetical protein
MSEVEKKQPLWCMVCGDTLAQEDLTEDPRNAPTKAIQVGGLLSHAKHHGVIEEFEKILGKPYPPLKGEEPK